MKISCVIVTFNRKELLCECINSVVNQSFLADDIWIIDNASSDGTQDLLLFHGYIKELPPPKHQTIWHHSCNFTTDGNRLIKINYLKMPFNCGGAGGFYEGVRSAYYSGADWIWLMDDDSQPDKDALLKLAEAVKIHRDVDVFSSLKLNREGNIELGHRGWFDFRNYTSSFIRKISPDIVKKRFVEIEHSSFVGFMLSKKVVKKVGFPDKKYFIQLDDVEYSLRIKYAGLKMLLVTDSIIVHKEKGVEKRKKKILFFTFTTSRPYKTLWLRYYGLRNMIYLKRKYCSFCVAFLIGLKIVFKRIISVILRDDNKFRRIKFYISAFNDGLRGVFDNEKPKRILYG